MPAPRPTELRRVRERELIAATRALFDGRGMQHAPIEEIARAAGIARGLIYRQFSSKEELFVLTVTDYLHELRALLETAGAADPDPLVRTERCLQAYAGFCGRYPAFLDCSLSLMQRPARELRAVVSDAVWMRLGQTMAACLGIVAGVLRDGAEAGAFSVDDPDYMANVLWTQMLGTMHLARIGVGVRQLAPGLPGLFDVEPERLVRTCVDSALATLGVSRPG
jgi:AcrR family transcriptional regulator